jgi:hypothetical protein
MALNDNFGHEKQQAYGNLKAADRLNSEVFTLLNNYIC